MLDKSWLYSHKKELSTSTIFSLVLRKEKKGKFAPNNQICRVGWGKFVEWGQFFNLKSFYVPIFVEWSPAWKVKIYVWKDKHERANLANKGSIYFPILLFDTLLTKRLQNDKFNSRFFSLSIYLHASCDYAFVLQLIGKHVQLLIHRYI